MNESPTLEGEGIAGGGDTAPQDQGFWLGLARAAHKQSSDWWTQNLAKSLAISQAFFEGQHPPGSKYESDGFKHRSRVFRPKTRSAIRRHEAACASAFFSTQDVVNITPEDDGDDDQIWTARIYHELINHRLTRNIPWFRLLVGAYQDSLVGRVCISKQTWEYIEEEERVVHDRPRIDLIPLENFRIDPGSDWLDPIGSSPYLIHVIPMFVADVKQRMNTPDPKTGLPEWKQMEDSEILLARLSRENESEYRRDARNRPETSQQQDVAEYSLVEVLEVILKHEGRDWIFWTLGTHRMLTDPAPLEEVYRHGRPYVMGHSVLAAHNPFPRSMVELLSGLQTTLNDLQNQRFDNVQLALNRRKYARRNSNIDMAALVKSRAGGVVLMQDPAGDVREEQVSDVTSSSYHEQDRINADFDDMSGTFNNGSVATSRNLNETVGGMRLASGSADVLADYTLRVFAETWVEPVLRQLIKLEEAYETDINVLRLAFKSAGIEGDAQGFSLLQTGSLVVSVNVGINAANPQAQLERFVAGMTALGNMLVIPGINREEVTKEIFGKLGYKDGSRFFIAPEAQNAPSQPDPNALEMQYRQQELNLQMQVEQAKLQVEQAKLQLQRDKMQFDAKRMEAEHELAMIKLATEQNLRLEDLRARTAMKDKDIGSKERAQAVEVAIKQSMGSGI